MRAIYCELRRAVFNKWFSISVVGTVAFLWLGIGDDSYWMLRDNEYLFNAARVIRNMLTSEGALLSLPALAALPCAAAALAELSCGAARQKVFVCGRRAYRLGKIAGCACSALLSQLISVALLSELLCRLAHSRGASREELVLVLELYPMLITRVLSAAAFACFGSVVALITSAPASAYVAPMAMCFTLKLLGSRFFIGVSYVDPADWLKGDAGALYMTLALCAGLLLIMDAALRREMKRRA